MLGACMFLQDFPYVPCLFTGFYSVLIVIYDPLQAVWFLQLQGPKFDTVLQYLCYRYILLCEKRDKQGH